MHLPFRSLTVVSVCIPSLSDTSYDARHRFHSFIHPRYLESVLTGSVPWNFEKYLVGKDGVPVQKSGASSSPEFMEIAIAKLLAGKSIA